MQYKKIKIEDTELEISAFSNNGVSEMHLFAKPLNDFHFKIQLKNSYKALETFLFNEKIKNDALIFIRLFLSDYANQIEDLNAFKGQVESKNFDCAVSIVQEPPLKDSKVVLWAYIIDDNNISKVDKSKNSNNELVLNRGAYKHLWTTQLTSTDFSESFEQTKSVFVEYNHSLKQKGLSLKDNCIRTWVYVKDVDTNYSGVVKARKEFFKKIKMDEETHFITSTGIEGRHFDPKTIVLMDAYSVGGISSKQIKFLEAPENLNPTHEYGVTFERGTSIDYGDRKHIYISGTASIDNKGKVLHKKNIDKQIKRIFINITALLANADSKMQDVAQMIIYLRDIADRDKVIKYFEKNYQDIPKVIVLAPVCRPEWLVEVECIAISKISNNEFYTF